MNYRAKNIVIAVALAALAAILTSVYVVNYKRHVQHGEGKVTVLVAARDIPAGTSGADIVDQKMLRKETIPRKAVVAGAISSPDQLSQYIATEDVFAGEQVSTRRFAPPSEQGIRAQIKGTQRAYQVEGDSHQLLAGTLKAGDHVDVVATWGIKVPSQGQNNTDDSAIVSRVVLRDLLLRRVRQAAGVARKPSRDRAGRRQHRRSRRRSGARRRSPGRHPPCDAEHHAAGRRAGSNSRAHPRPDPDGCFQRVVRAARA